MLRFGPGSQGELANQGAVFHYLASQRNKWKDGFQAMQEERNKLDAALKAAQDRITQLEFDSNEKDKGAAQIRAAFAEAGVTTGRLDERARCLANERDTWKARALIAEASLSPAPAAKS